MAFFVFLWTLFFISPAYAYINVDTYNMSAQLLLAVIIALLFTLKMYWPQVKERLQRLFSGKMRDGDKK